KAGYRKTPSARFEFAEFAEAIGTIVEEWRPDLVLPSCEEVFYLAAAFAQQGRSGLLFAPPFELLARVHHKAEFAALATQVGFGADENHLLSSPDDVRTFSGDP